MRYGIGPYQNPCGLPHQAPHANPSEYRGMYMPWGLPRHLAEEAERAEQEAYEKIAGTLDTLESYELNPQTRWGAGGGYYDRRGSFHPGGGRRLDPRHFPRPPYDYHPGGGHYNHGYHPGAGYFANNPSYTVRSSGEEFQCSACGYPVYVGDRAYEDPSSGEVFCCKKCAGKTRRNPPPPVYGYGHLPYAARVAPGMATPFYNNPKRRRPVSSTTPTMKEMFKDSIDGAYAHGEESDPDHTAGDLEAMLRAAWRAMDARQRIKFLRSQEVREARRWAGYGD